MLLRLPASICVLTVPGLSVGPRKCAEEQKLESFYSKEKAESKDTGEDLFGAVEGNTQKRDVEKQRNVK